MPRDRFPKLNSWASVMKSTPGVERTLTTDAHHKGFIDSFTGFQGADYDYGL